MIFTERSGVSPYVLGVMALLALFLASVFFAYRRMRRWRVSTGTEGMIGEVGTVKVPVVQGVGGQVFVHGERWRAVPENPEEGPIRAGTEVEVTGFRNGAVVVRALEHHGSTGTSRP
jgi:membrane protein implicated in regulation of membrane protease activity